MKKNPNNTSGFKARWKKRLLKVFHMYAEILESCEWFPVPRQTKLPPF